MDRFLLIVYVPLGTFHTVKMRYRSGLLIDDLRKFPKCCFLWYFVVLLTMYPVPNKCLTGTLNSLG
jgi:hypothetical protein